METPNPTLEEIKRSKRLLEDQLSEAVHRFETVTGCRVMDMNRRTEMIAGGRVVVGRHQVVVTI